MQVPKQGLVRTPDQYQNRDWLNGDQYQKRDSKEEEELRKRIDLKKAQARFLNGELGS